MTAWTLPLAATWTAAVGPGEEIDPAGWRLRARARCRVATGTEHTRAVQVPAQCPSDETQSSDERRPR